MSSRTLATTFILIALHLVLFVAVPFVVMSNADDQSSASAFAAQLLVFNFLPATQLDRVPGISGLLTSSLGSPSDLGLAVCVLSWITWYAAVSLVLHRLASAFSQLSGERG